jgi:signal transduction histidine kinase
LSLLPTLVDQFGRSGLRVEVHTQGVPRRLHAAADLSAYRVVQEALTNTLKHSGARHADVSIRWVPDALEIEVRDGGRGRNGSSSQIGQGLVGMRERVSLLGGEFLADNADSGGFVVLARIPVDAA